MVHCPLWPHLNECFIMYSKYNCRADHWLFGQYTLHVKMLCVQDPGTISLHELMVKHGVTDEQLDREINDKDTALISTHFDDFENYIHRLELTGNEQAHVKKIAQVSGNQVAVINCLSIWRSHEPSKATFRVLIRILLDLRKEEVASKICQYLVIHCCMHSLTVCTLYSKIIAT